MAELYSGRFERYGRWLGVQRSLDRLSNPPTHDACCRMLESAGYRIADSQSLRQAVCFRSFDDVRAWAVDSGWLVNGRDKHIGWRIAGGRALFQVGELLLHPLYPIHATSEMSIVLAQKPVDHKAGAPAFEGNPGTDPVPPVGNSRPCPVRQPEPVATPLRRVTPPVQTG